VLELADLRDAYLGETRDSARRIDPAPVNMTLFGSFARGDDDGASDVDVIVVRPRSIGDYDVTSRLFVLGFL
jgi:predicted nucleotidyltransferase